MAETNVLTDRRELLTVIVQSPLPMPTSLNFGEVVFLNFDAIEDLRAWAIVVGAQEFKTREEIDGRLFSYWNGGLIKGVVPVVLTASEPLSSADAATLVAEAVAVLDEPKAAAPNVLLDATLAALPEPKPGQQYTDYEGDLWQVQSDGTLLWLDTRDIKDRQAGLTKPNLLHLAKDFGPLSAGPLVEVTP